MDLEQWLARLERAHPRGIDMGLERVGAVWKALGAPRPATRVITVAGTNGKGSTVAFIEAAARACGLRVGAYTSPHLLRYNERIRIDGTDAGDAGIVAAFERIEAARDGISLTYFETGTLAALLLMAEAGLDLAVLEVGLGGRLDAVNIIDADVAVVTTVALDHQDWLGDTRDLIAREKAAVARKGRPLVVGEREAVPALVETAAAIGARILRLGVDFDVLPASAEQGETAQFLSAPLAGDAAIPLPALPLSAPVQHDNAATALAALLALDADAGGLGTLEARRAAAGLAQARLRGRLQRVARDPDVLVDVGHNPQAAQVLAHWLGAQGDGPATDAVYAGLADKDIAGVVSALRPYVRHWHLAGLPEGGPRALSVEALAGRVSGPLSGARISTHDDVAAALESARGGAGKQGRVLVFGSFLTVTAAMKALGADA
ncbi:bifunctional tetrahydrofolate synthase/dihydrofolate synthase [Pseudofulvimonas gallinarii]|uniref:Dihydrofolate synthase/folylpolyglutamate synthase n=1 Tax=Pseudofulvimonas gallinarii TaxID=634155 RepID=A0A4S3KVG9_9GAMM|nr:bifunctional tetrahydrofolate synthase/dihydrofolate synthase [Pseudofulvimonas gallinarii]TCS97398.1 dihydrofolate synthase/folylpolyglutamate synthase [Pseudofulvimonas gallinarii]THD13227.1 bifunctional tetrahydrofolate synthase/dihydrofolate synthase [Pseudofulvimonas gallinarii]